MLYIIRIKDGAPFEHPIAVSNFIDAFPTIDVNNLPPEFAWFERVERPDLGVYEYFVSEEPTYELIDGIWKDVWHISNVSDERKLAMQQGVKDAWASLNNAENWTAWVFDEATCSFQPPTPKPDDGKKYIWHGLSTAWVEIPKRPDDGKSYKLDLTSVTWVEVQQP